MRNSRLLLNRCLRWRCWDSCRLRQPSSRAGGNAYILAIEPEHENLRRLFFNVDANRGLPITVLPHALGDAAGVLEIEPNMEDRGGTRTRRVGAAGSNGYKVECKPLMQMLNKTTRGSLK